MVDTKEIWTMLTKKQLVGIMMDRYRHLGHCRGFRSDMRPYTIEEVIEDFAQEIACELERAKDVV